MSWQVGAFAILALGLAGGFAWYERTRPDARIVALVGTLAAFAALGRIAFAAIPNVKPTTDIVLISGYALGGAPGFVVGALAGLSSNFFFGQGPWTPWQMAAWGVTGLLGAGLALATGRRIGRWPLALICTVVGFAFTTVQDVGDWVTYSDHSLAQLGVYVGKGLGFDAVHAAGCLVFALAFGPALVRAISRFAARLQVVWQPAGPVGARDAAGAGGAAGTRDTAGAGRAVRAGGAAGAAVIVLASLALTAGLGAPPSARAGATPTSYLLGAQNNDGGFGSAPGSSSSPLYSGWAALGLAAEGYNPRRVTRDGHSLIDYIAAGAPSDIGSVERTILVARAAGLSPAGFGGQNLLAALERDMGGDGSVSDQVNLTSFAVLALKAAGVVPSARTLSWLARQQDQDGGFNFATAGGTSDVDDTGAALEALAGAGGQSAASARARAVGFIRAQQNPDGGFPAGSGASSNAQSTAWAIQGLLAAGVDPDSLHRGGAPSPAQYLQSLIAGDGHVSYARGSDQTPVWVTAEAAMALARKPLPLAPVQLPGTASAGRPSTASPSTASPSAAGAIGGAGSHQAAARAAATSATSAASAATAGAVATGSGQKANAGGRGAAAASSSIDRLAVDAGIMTALVLAPIGAG